MKKPFKCIEVKKFSFLPDRFLVALLSVVIFAICLFIFQNGEIAIVLGFVVSAAFVATDYKRIYNGNRNPEEKTC